jgi:hypothetical protein
MALHNDREQLRRSFISIFVEHPVITLVATMLLGAGVRDVLKSGADLFRVAPAATSICGVRLLDQADQYPI